MKLTPDQLKSLGYNPNDPGEVLRKVTTVPIPAHENPVSSHFHGVDHAKVADKVKRPLKSTPRLFWVDYEVKSLNRTRYQHWTVARKHIEAAKLAWACVGDFGIEWINDPPILPVKIISFRSRILDSDNYISGCKGLRDAIAKSLGMDDSDRFIQWHYHQIIGKPHGTLVMIA